MFESLAYVYLAVALCVIGFAVLIVLGGSCIVVDRFLRMLASVVLFLFGDLNDAKS